jgi:calcineurin-like phosphoesterase family protein
MVNILKFATSHESNVFLSSDLHYRHNPQNWDVPIWKVRGFDSSSAHDSGVISAHNKTVSNNDTCFFLGDSMLGAKIDPVKEFTNLFSILNYKTAYVMAGNHFSAYRQLFNKALESGERIDEFYRLKININSREVYFIPNYYEVIINFRTFILSHYPILSWNNMGKNSVMCFGHCHQNLEKTNWIKDNYLKGKNIDLSWDCYKKPLSANEIMSIVDKKEILKIDHH